MLFYDRLDLGKGINPAKTSNSKECIIYQYCFFSCGFKFRNSVCNGCKDLTMLCLNLSDIAIIAFKEVDYHCIFYDICKSVPLRLLENSVLDDRGYISKMHIKEINIKSRVFGSKQKNEKLTIF